MSNVTCPDGWRDDNFLVFFSSRYDGTCALPSVSHYALNCFWLAATLYFVLEAIVAKLRKLDKAPVGVQVVRNSWFCVNLVLFIYLVAVPDATVHDKQDAAVILTCMGLRIVGCVLLAGFVGNHLMLTGKSAVALYVGSHKAGSAGDAESQRNRPVEEFDRLLYIDDHAFAPLCISMACVAFVLVATVPNGLGVTTTDPAYLERFLTATWSIFALCSLFQPFFLASLTLKIRAIVQDSVDFIKSIENKNHRRANGKDDSQNNKKSTHSSDGSSGSSKMYELQARLTNNAVIICIIGSVTAAFLITAAVLGLQYWIFHIVMAQTILIDTAYVNFFRSKPLIAWLPSASATVSTLNDPDVMNSSVDKRNNTSRTGKHHHHQQRQSTISEIIGSPDGDQVHVGNVTISMVELTPTGTVTSNNDHGSSYAVPRAAAVDPVTLQSGRRPSHELSPAAKLTAAQGPNSEQLPTVPEVVAVVVDDPNGIHRPFNPLIADPRW